MAWDERLDVRDSEVMVGRRGSGAWRRMCALPQASGQWLGKVAGIIGLLLMGLALGGCSAVRLGYNNLPDISYWWLDGYLDFDGAQSLQVKRALAGLQDWHRREELPRLATLAAQARDQARSEITPAQVCALSDAVQARLLALAVRAEPDATVLAQSLAPAQLQVLERKFGRINNDFRREWLRLTTAEVQDKRYDTFLDRYEDFYGTLDARQRGLLRQMVRQSAFSPEKLDAARRARQADVLALLRGLQQPPAATDAQARQRVHALIMRVFEPPPGEWRSQQDALAQEACNNTATLHAAMTPAQRERAAQRIEAYRQDLVALSGP